MDIKQESDRLKKEAVEQLEKLIERFDLSPRVLEPILGLGYRTLYRWLSGSKLFIPSLKECGSIIGFCSEIRKVEADMKDQVISFNGNKSTVTLGALYQHDMLTILQDNLEIEDKIKKLVKLAVRKWSGALK